MLRLPAQRLISFVMALALVLGFEVHCTSIAHATAVVTAATLDADGCTDCASCKGNISECGIHCSTVVTAVDNLKPSFPICGFVALPSTNDQLQSQSLEPDTAPPRS